MALEETNTSDQNPTTYVFFGGQRIARIDPGASSPKYYVTDNVGSTALVTDASGNVLNESLFFPSGVERVVSQGDTANNYRFSGKERDTETGLDDFGARYYDSSLGRFMTPDWAAKPTSVPYASFGDPQTLNLYAYVENGPLNRVDADGHVSGLVAQNQVPSDSCNGYENGECMMSGMNGTGASADPNISEQETQDEANAVKKQQQQQEQSAQQQSVQDPTLPTAVAPSSHKGLDGLLDAIFPKTWGDMASLAAVVPTDGLAEGAAPLAKAMEMSSSIGEDSKLVKYAEDAGKSVQKGLDSLTKELSKGNTNPGLGSKSLGKGISYARARDGARVFYQQAGNKIDILGEGQQS